MASARAWQRALLATPPVFQAEFDSLGIEYSINMENVLFKEDGGAISPDEIMAEIARFDYNEAVAKILQRSKVLDKGGKAFAGCAELILSNFGMTRGGPFKDDMNQKLSTCWKKVGGRLIRIRNTVRDSGLSRDRFLLELEPHKREELIEEIWSVTKELLPITMGKTSYGLVGASKILFSIFPEIVLPIDNSQWLHVFHTVDLGDVIRRMALEIQHWEDDTGKRLNEMDSSRKLTTLPCVYNVMAMAARPEKAK